MRRRSPAGARESLPRTSLPPMVMASRSISRLPSAAVIFIAPETGTASSFSGGARPAMAAIRVASAPLISRSPTSLLPASRSEHLAAKIERQIDGIDRGDGRQPIRRQPASLRAECGPDGRCRRWTCRPNPAVRRRCGRPPGLRWCRLRRRSPCASRRRCRRGARWLSRWRRSPRRRSAGRRRSACAPPKAIDPPIRSGARSCRRRSLGRNALGRPSSSASGSTPWCDFARRNGADRALGSSGDVVDLALQLQAVALVPGHAQHRQAQVAAPEIELQGHVAIGASARDQLPGVDADRCVDRLRLGLAPPPAASVCASRLNMSYRLAPAGTNGRTSICGPSMASDISGRPSHR